MKHLREKIHFPCFQFCKVVQKHQLGEVEKYNIVWLLAFLIIFLPNIMKIRQCLRHSVVLRSLWFSGRTRDCGARGPRFESHRGRLCLCHDVMMTAPQTLSAILLLILLRTHLYTRPWPLTLKTFFRNAHSPTLIQLLDLACRTLFWSNCAIQTSPMDCSDDLFRQARTRCSVTSDTQRLRRTLTYLLTWLTLVASFTQISPLNIETSHHMKLVPTDGQWMDGKRMFPLPEEK